MHPSCGSLDESDWHWVWDSPWGGTKAEGCRELGSRSMSQNFLSCGRGWKGWFGGVKQGGNTQYPGGLGDCVAERSQESREHPPLLLLPLSSSGMGDSGVWPGLGTQLSAHSTSDRCCLQPNTYSNFTNPQVPQGDASHLWLSELFCGCWLTWVAPLSQWYVGHI